MLRGVFFKNFVGFEKAQSVLFPENESPGIFVGENGSGKSSLLEGIRRCLSSNSSTTTSSVYDDGEHSFFVCKYDTAKCDEAVQNTDLFTGILKAKTTNRYYKFVSTPTELLIDQHESSGGHLQLTGTADSISNILDEALKAPDTFEPNAILDPKATVADAEENVFSPVGSERSKVEEILNKLENYVVMTFPLRSVGPLQWSKSEKISKDKQKDNYLEACQREEIIRYFLEKKDQEFDHLKEEKYFSDLSGRGDISFTLSGKYIVVKSNETILPGENQAFLKIPEGILEAKHFSILMSSTKYLTVVLEEPDAGMQTQMVERMMSIIRSERKNKLVVLSTHNSSFVNPTTISRLTIFKRIKPQRNGKKKNVPTEVISGADIVEREEQSLKVLQILTNDNFATLIFAKKILFCEGYSDFLFLTALKELIMESSDCVVHILSLIPESEKEKKKNRIHDLQKNTVSLQVISIDGWNNAERMHDLCKKLKLDDHYFVCDKDVVIDYNEETKVVNMSKRCRWFGKDEIIDIEKEFNSKGMAGWETVREKLRKLFKCFVWRDGTIEDMLMSLLRGETEERDIPPIEAEGEAEGIPSVLPPPYDSEVIWPKKRKVIRDLKNQNVDLPLIRWKEKRPKLRDSARGKADKIFLHPAVTHKNILKSVEIFLTNCNDIQDDLVQFVNFLLHIEDA